jgi:hypothetical protein
MPAEADSLTRPASGCLGYPIFILVAVPQGRSNSYK